MAPGRFAGDRKLFMFMNTLYEIALRGMYSRLIKMVHSHTNTHAHKHTHTRIHTHIRITIYTPYLALPGVLWDVYCADIGENWMRYNDTALFECHIFSIVWSFFCQPSNESNFCRIFIIFSKLNYVDSTYYWNFLYKGLIDTNLAPYKRQTILWTSGGLSYWRIYASLRYNEYIL